ncbi:MAG: S8 family serine peptidase [Longimicrobiales bacterium]
MGRALARTGSSSWGSQTTWGGCTSDGQQSQGICTPWDDHTYVQYPYQGGHGTAMTGLVGANDNSFGRQGIAPEATVYSLKISFNTYPSGRGTCGGVESTFCVEDDDILAALNWATYNNLDVLSMSFAGYGAPAIMDALDDAYNYGDVLLLSALGNSEEDDPDYYSANGSVMGVASVDADGNYRRFIVVVQPISDFSG